MSLKRGAHFPARPNTLSRFYGLFGCVFTGSKKRSVFLGFFVCLVSCLSCHPRRRLQLSGASAEQRRRGAFLLVVLLGHVVTLVIVVFVLVFVVVMVVVLAWVLVAVAVFVAVLDLSALCVLSNCEPAAKLDSPGKQAFDWYIAILQILD